MVEETQDRLAVATVLGNRLFYSINWYSIPPIFYLIALDLHTKVSGLGLISSAFLVGIGLFQVPGALLSARVGARSVCILGMVILSVSALLCAVVSSIDLIALLRFFSGMGMALFFPPSISLMTKLSRPGRAGFVLGLNNAMASVGGGIGLLAWGVIGDSVGWRLSLALIGGLGLASTVFLILLVPRDEPTRDFQFRLRDLRRVLLDKWLLLLGCVLLAYNVGNTLDATFVEVYLHDSLGLSAGLSGGIGSLVIFSGLFTAPIAGHFYNRVARVKLVLAASGLAIGLGVALASLATPLAVATSAVTVGLASGVGYTFAFGSAWNTSKERAQRAIALSWVNSIQLLFSFWAPYLFSFVVVGYGYRLAWLTGGLYTAVFILPLVLSRGAPAPQAEAE
ncbi:MAG TPA: MFS transporter [Nitrososphaerales archaeon]|nr:MFS transporter [Nitrososphaerales archaeon]